MICVNMLHPKPEVEHYDALSEIVVCFCRTVPVPESWPHPLRVRVTVKRSWDMVGDPSWYTLDKVQSVVLFKKN